MTNATSKLCVMAAAALLVTGAMRAQAADVTIGPLAPSGAAGGPVNFDISFTGPTTANGLSFNLIYGATEKAAFSPVFKGTSTTLVDCSTASDLDPGIATSAVVLSSGKIAFTVIGLSLTTGPIPFGRTGVVGTCKFTIASGASTIPLTIENTTSTCTASDASGSNLTADCPSGTLTVAGGPTPTSVPTDVTIGPLEPSGAPGQPVNFDISFTGPTTTNGLSFNLIYGATEQAAFTPVFKGTSTTNVDCSTASDLDPGIATSAVVLSSGKIAFTVIGLSLTTGPIPIGRTGVVGTCKFTIAAGATTIPLTVENTTSTCTASDASGSNLTAACPSGTLTVSSGPSPTATSTPPPPTNTPTNTVKAPPTNTPGGGGFTAEDEGGCHIAGPATSGSGWLLLIPAVGLLVLRRKRR